MTEQPGFVYWECKDCGFDAVTTSIELVSPRGRRTLTCPLCAGDSGREVPMKCRVATDEDKVEGKDARNELQNPREGRP